MDRFITLKNIGNILGNLEYLQNLVFPIINLYVNITWLRQRIILAPRNYVFAIYIRSFLEIFHELIRISKLVDTLASAGEEINYLPEDAKVTTTLLELEIDAPIICLKAEFTGGF
jgi:hypothetical protein